MTRKKVVAVSAGLWAPSKTTALAQTLLEAVAERLNAEASLIDPTKRSSAAPAELMFKEP